MGYKTIGGIECWVGNGGCHFNELLTSNNEEEYHHFHDDDGDCDDDDNDANCKVGNFCQDKSLGGCPSVGLNYDLDIKILVLWMVRTQM